MHFEEVHFPSFAIRASAIVWDLQPIEAWPAVTIRAAFAAIASE